MKVGVLTSSRADFGIYLPLLQKMKCDLVFKLEIIAFGTHLSKYHGYTIEGIKNEGFPVIHEISSILTNDDEVSIATAYGLTAVKFADFWNGHHFDWVLCLGDRFEMAAAVQAGIPFGVKFAHIHGGETTLGAIDNIYRHQITLASQLHFPSTEEFAEKIAEIIGAKENIYPVGSLSIEDIENLPIPSEEVFREKYGIHKEFILLTFHPETVSPEKNRENAAEMLYALKEIAEDTLLVITMPNADTNGTLFREALFSLKEECNGQVILIESFGKLNYFAAMRYCKFLIGNTSSGIIEAASFGKYAINVGDRQKGRAQNSNVINVSFDSVEIIKTADTLQNKDTYKGDNIYKKVGTTLSILKYLKS